MGPGRTAGIFWAVCACATLLAAGPARAEGEGDDGWRVIVSPYVWAASLDGDLALAGLQTPVDAPFSDIFDHLDFVAMAEAEIGRGRWALLVDGEYVKTSQEERVLGAPVDLGIRTVNVDVAVAYRAYERPLGGTTRLGRPRRFTIEPIAGARWTRLEAEVAAPGLEAGRKSEWTEPILGVRADYDVDAAWTLAGRVDVGVGGDDDSVNAGVMLGYGAQFLGRPTVWRFGYRLLWQDHRARDFTGGTFRWDVTRQGPVAGFSMQF